MSTQETVDYPLGPCPCGAGRVIQEVTTQDNAYSGADIYNRIDCATCSAEWSISGTATVYLRDRSGKRRPTVTMQRRF